MRAPSTPRSQRTPYRCAGDHDVVVAVQNTREWRTLCDATGVPALAEDPWFLTNERRVHDSAALDAVLGARIREISSDELIERPEAAGLAWDRVNDLHEVLAHEQLRARKRWMTVSTPNGDFQALRSPVDIGIEIPPGRVPGLGEHTDAVLEWLPGDPAPST